MRQRAMTYAEEKFGKLNKENHSQILKYVKAEEIKWKKRIIQNLKRSAFILS